MPDPAEFITDIHMWLLASKRSLNSKWIETVIYGDTLYQLEETEPANIDEKRSHIGTTCTGAATYGLTARSGSLDPAPEQCTTGTRLGIVLDVGLMGFRNWISFAARA